MTDKTIKTSQILTHRIATQSIYICILLSLPLLMLCFARFTLEDTDSGFIVAAGWRIFNGELPYRDFYYVRPPLPLYLSAFWLWITPDYAQVLSMRLINYYQLLLQVYLSSLILSRFYDFKQLKLNIYPFIIFSFFCTAVGTLYFQWHTTDGIFFAVLGFYILTRPKPLCFLHCFLHCFFAGICFVLSALCKQNFAMVIVLALAFSLIQYGWKRTLQLGLGILLSLMAFYFYLQYFQLTALFLQQNTGISSLKDLFYAGIVVYFAGHQYLLLCCVFSVVLYKVMDLYGSKWMLQQRIFMAAWFSFILLNILAIILLHNSMEKFVYFDRILPILLICSVVILFKLRDYQQHALLIALIGIAWTSSISWGGTTPIMYFTPIIFASYYLLQTRFNLFSSNMQIVLSLSMLVYSVLANWVPYRDVPIWQTRVDSRGLLERLAGLQINPVIKAKHLALQQLFINYPDSAVLPSMPAAHYYNHRKNPLPIDWPMDVEIGYQTEALKRALYDCCEYVMVEKKAIGQGVGTEGKFHSSITLYVMQHYLLYNSSNEYFDVYKRPIAHHQR